mmetsp:Transcript_17810/g.25677  ORF Transcript_17810/g.25677 Transcript_17810/m.25677 type:complete len:400 (-) Transcript_17810:609-1808(-)
MEEVLLERLQKALQLEGLTPFSSKIAVEFLKKQLQEERNNSQALFARVIGFSVELVNKLNGIRPIESKNSKQRGCPSIIPGLTAQPFWRVDGSCSTSASSEETIRVQNAQNYILSVVKLLEESYPVIKEEFMNLREVYKHQDTATSSTPKSISSGFQHYRSPLQTISDPIEKGFLPDSASSATDKGDWNVFYFFLHGLNFDDNLQRCPRTAAILSSIPRHYSHAFFSSLAPDTHIKPHFGPTNKKLRCHLPIHIPRPQHQQQRKHEDDSISDDKIAYLRVDGEEVELQEGRCVVFDDSFLHEAANLSISEPRTVLVVDLWHPDFSDAEVRFMSFINNAQIKAAQRMHKLRREQCEERVSSEQQSSHFNSEVYEDFFGAIQHSKMQGISVEDVELIWGKE